MQNVIVLLLLKAASSDGRQDNFIEIYIHGQGIFIFSLQYLLYIHVYFCDDYFLFLDKNIFRYEKKVAKIDFFPINQINVLRK